MTWYVHTCIYCMSLLAVPGLIFIVNQDVIQYVQLTESSLEIFFSLLEEVTFLLNETQITAATITGRVREYMLMHAHVHCVCTCICII